MRHLPNYLKYAALGWGLLALSPPNVQAAKPPKAGIERPALQGRAHQAKQPIRKLRRDKAARSETARAPARFPEVAKALGAGVPHWESSMGEPSAAAPWAITTAEAAELLRGPQGVAVFSRKRWTVAVSPQRLESIALARRATEAMLAYVRSEPMEHKVQDSFAIGKSARLLKDLADAFGAEAAGGDQAPLLWPALLPAQPIPSRADLLRGLADHLTRLDDMAAGHRSGLPPKIAIIGVDGHVASLIAGIAAQPRASHVAREGYSDLGWLEVYPAQEANAPVLAEGGHFYDVAKATKVVAVQRYFNAHVRQEFWQVTIERDGQREQHYYDGIITQ